MKRIIIAALAVTAAAVAAQAQGFGTVRDINDFGKEYAQANTKAVQKKASSLEKEVQKQHIAHLRAEEQKKAAEAKKQAPAQTQPAQDKPATAQQPAQAKSSAPQAKSPSKKKVSLWRYILPGPLPNESWSEYSARMSYAGSQPFK